MSNPKKLDRRIAYTKMVLKQSLVKLLKDKPLSRITIKELCQSADINRGTFYSHYNDQFDLLHQMEQEVLNELIGKLSTYSFKENESESLQVLNNIFEYIANNNELCMVLLGNNGNMDFQKKIIKIVQKQFIKEWTDNNYIDKDMIEYLFIFVATGSIGVIQEWLIGGTKKSPHEMAEIIVKLTTQGISGLIK